MVQAARMAGGYRGGRSGCSGAAARRSRHSAAAWAASALVLALCVLPRARGLSAASPSLAFGCNASAAARGAYEALRDGYWDSSVKATTPFGPRNGKVQRAVDSIFASMAYAHFDQSRAEAEMKYLLGAQWTTGMLPNARYFNTTEESTRAFPPPELWGDHTKAPQGVTTSGLATLPLHAHAVLHNYYLAANSGTALQFMEGAYSTLLSYFRWLKENRRVPGSSSNLLYIRHPDEDLMPGAASWEPFMPNTTALKCSGLPKVPKSVSTRAEFPGAQQAERQLCLSQCAAVHLYDEHEIREKCGFVVYSVVFNAVFARGCNELALIGELVNAPADEVQLLQGWANETVYAITNPETGLYDARAGFFVDRGVMPGLQHGASAPVFSRSSSVSATAISALLVGSAAAQEYSPKAGSGSDSGPAAVSDDRPPERALSQLDQELAARLQAGEAVSVAAFDGDVAARGRGLGGANDKVAGWETAVLGRVLSEFWPLPALPTLSRFDPAYSATAGMNGPVWKRTNWLAIHALLETGFIGVGGVLKNYSMGHLSCGTNGTQPRLAEAFDSSPTAGAPPTALVNSTSAASAGLTVLLLLPPGAPVTPTPVPLEWWGVLVVIVVELVCVAAVGVSCIIISVRQLRRLSKREDDAPAAKPDGAGMVASGSFLSLTGASGAMTPHASSVDDRDDASAWSGAVDYDDEGRQGSSYSDGGEYTAAAEESPRAAEAAEDNTWGGMFYRLWGGGSAAAATDADGADESSDGVGAAAVAPRRSPARADSRG